MYYFQILAEERERQLYADQLRPTQYFSRLRFAEISNWKDEVRVLVCEYSSEGGVPRNKGSDYAEVATGLKAITRRYPLSMNSEGDNITRCELSMTAKFSRHTSAE
jgi:hypothetical protein